MIQKVAIFRALHLGDMLCLIPTVRAIRAAWPRAEIFLIGLPWQTAFVARFNQYFDHFIEFPGWPGLPEQLADPEKILAFLSKIRKLSFDVVFQMQGNGELTNAMCMLWGASTVCGLRKPGEYAPDEALFPISEDSDHEVTRFFKLLDCMNIPHRDSCLEFPLHEDEQRKARALMENISVSPKEFVCIHPGARDPRRRWPVSNFAHIANEIGSRHLPVVLTGSAEEAALLGQLQHLTRAPVVNIVEMFGHLSIGELACLLSQSKLLVSNDTGVSHLAAALKIASVTIFSPYSDYRRWHPLDAQRNQAITHEEAKNPGYVLERVLEALSDC